MKKRDDKIDGDGAGGGGGGATMRHFRNFQDFRSRSLGIHNY